MPHHERRTIASAPAVALALALALAACGSRAPRAWRPSVHEVQKLPRGSWIYIEIDDGRRAFGEFLAIDANAQIAYLVMANTLARVPRSRIRYLEVTFYKGEVGEATGWGLSGTVSTLSHGFVLLLSAPVWLITTGIVGSVESSAGTVSYRAARGSLTAEAFAGLRKYARFPQGLPEGFTLQPTSPPSLTSPPAAPATPVPPSSGPAAPSLTPPPVAPATPAPPSSGPAAPSPSPKPSSHQPSPQPPSTTPGAPAPPATAPGKAVQPSPPAAAPAAPALPAQPAAPPDARPPGR